MTAHPKTLPKVIIGANEFGAKINASQADKIIGKCIDTVDEDTVYIDTAIQYCRGKSELLLSRYSNHPNISISTKVSPFRFSGLDDKSIELQCNISLQSLRYHDHNNYNENKPKLDILYIHQGTKSTPILQTLFAINKLYKQGKFKRFGICHYSSWQVAEIVFLCQKYNLIKPSVYQGRYNALRRDNESELIPCLRHFDIAFYAFSPTARGILTDGDGPKRHQFDDLKKKSIKKGKFTSEWAKIHFKDYWYISFFKARDIIDKSIENENIPFLQANFSWLLYHSILDGSRGDRIILGGSKYQHFEQNFDAIKNAKPLNDKIIAAFDRAWTVAKTEYLSYHQDKEQVLELFAKKTAKL